MHRGGRREDTVINSNELVTIQAQEAIQRTVISSKTLKTRARSWKLDAQKDHLFTITVCRVDDSEPGNDIKDRGSAI